MTTITDRRRERYWCRMINRGREALGRARSLLINWTFWEFKGEGRPELHAQPSASPLHLLLMCLTTTHRGWVIRPRIVLSPIIAGLSTHGQDSWHFALC
jgi:hypothetical protein